MERMFETERLIVRKFRMEDARQLYENHMPIWRKRRTRSAFMPIVSIMGVCP